MVCGNIFKALSIPNWKSSPVTCKKKIGLHFFKKKKKNNYLQKKMDEVVELVGGGSVINGAYPV